MTTRKGKGFTLIELLVVIAIIAILAAMLFPVFARARESARKIQCLSNIKNIALALNMYLTDYDRFPPSEHRSEVYDYLYGQPGAGSTNECRVGEPGERVQWMCNLANPYIRWPVVLDEYTRNRDVWRCPSARTEAAASFILANPNWLKYLQDNQGSWGDTPGFGPCYHMTFPPGWGGGVTDSILQQQNAGFGQRYGILPGALGTFVQGVTPAEENFYDVKMARLSNASAVPVVADGGLASSWLSIGTMAYPDICCAECSGLSYYNWENHWPDPDGCPEGTWCPDCVSMHANNLWAGEPDLKRASSRHLGGTNVGFADGHAEWIAAGGIMGRNDNKDFEWVGPICSPYTSYEGHKRVCGVEPGEKFLYNRATDWYGRDQ